MSVLTAASLMAVFVGSVAGDRGRILAAVGLTFVLAEAGAGHYVTTKVQEHIRASRENPVDATFGPEEYKLLSENVHPSVGYVDDRPYRTHRASGILSP